MYLPYQLQSAEYTAHQDEIRERTERRRAIKEAKESPATFLLPLGPRLRVELYRRAGRARRDREVDTRVDVVSQVMEPAWATIPHAERNGKK